MAIVCLLFVNAFQDEPAGKILELSILHLAMSEIAMLDTRHQIVINEVHLIFIFITIVLLQHMTTPFFLYYWNELLIICITNNTKIIANNRLNTYLHIHSHEHNFTSNETYILWYVCFEGGGSG